MSTLLTEQDISLKSLTELWKQIPGMKISVANAYALRGHTAKGAYETRIFLKTGEIRTTFLRKSGNPLRDMTLLSRTNLNTGEASFDGHAAAIRENEEKLPLIRKVRDSETGDEHVTILPFGDISNTPSIRVNTSARTGIVSLEVHNAHEMSPAEAKLVGEALIRAGQIAGRDKSLEP